MNNLLDFGGKVALVTGAGFDLAELRRNLVERLPVYARPLFLRIVSGLELTGTFKLRKQELALEGYDPARVRDLLYVDDAVRNAFVPLDDQNRGVWNRAMIDEGCVMLEKAARHGAPGPYQVQAAIAGKDRKPGNADRDKYP